MYGWRARLGVLVPSGITAIEPEFGMVTPEGVSCHYHRFKFAGSGETAAVLKDLKASAEYIADAAGLIMDVHPMAVAMTGTAVSFIGGYGYDQTLIKIMREKNGNLPTTTTSTSVIDALRRLGARKISIGLPYLEAVSKTAVKFVQDSGIQVLKAKWLDLSGSDIINVSAGTLYRLAREVDTPESEALFISCTALTTFPLIDKLEADLGKPVVTSNQATIWNLMRLAGINDKIAGYGQLLAKH